MPVETRHSTGVYFKLPWSEYLADPAVGGGAVKDLLVSPETYYWNNRDPDRTRNETEAKSRGAAYHTYVLEGPEQFAREYAAKPDPADYPEAAVTMADFKDACAELDIKPLRTKPETLGTLREHGWTGQAWDEIKDELSDGKTIISAGDIAKIARVEKMVRANPHVAAALATGWPEVSIFLELAGVPVRARVDWLGPEWHVSLKTFSNPRRTPLDKLLANIVAYEKYHVELVMYSHIIEAAKQLPAEAFHDAPDGFVEAFKAAAQHKGLFVFLGTDTPCVRARGLVARGMRRGVGGHGASPMTWDAGLAYFKEALDIYRRYDLHFDEDEPWTNLEPIVFFQDTQFPAFIME